MWPSFFESHSRNIENHALSQEKELNWHWIWFQGIFLVAGNSHRIKQYCYVMSTGCTAQGHFSWLSWLLVLEQKAFLLSWTKVKMAKDFNLQMRAFFTCNISANIFRRNYSFLNFEIVKLNLYCRNYSSEETFLGWTLFTEILYDQDFFCLLDRESSIKTDL